MSSSSSPESGTAELVPVLYMYRQYTLIGNIKKGATKSDIYEHVKKLFCDVPSLIQQSLIFKYEDNQWNEWVEIQEGLFAVDAKTKIRIETTTDQGIPSATSAAAGLGEKKRPTPADSTASSDSDCGSPKRPALTRILKHIWSKKMKVPLSSKSQKPKPSQSVRIQVGWLHYNDKTKEYAQVRSQKGGGVRFLTFDRKITHSNLKQKIIPLFFPDGKSSQGLKANMETHLANFQGHNIQEDEFSVDKLIEEKGLKTRIYLKTKQSELMSSSLSSVPDVPQPAISVSSDVSEPDPGAAVVVLDFDSPAAEETVGLDDSLPLFAFEEADTPTVLFRKTEQDASNTSLQPQHVLASDAPGPSAGSTPRNPFTSSTLCTICYDREKEVFFIPCGDTLCAVCASTVQINDGPCPFCKATIKKIKSFF